MNVLAHALEGEVNLRVPGHVKLIHSVYAPN
jgi:hypothetical protein